MAQRNKPCPCGSGLPYKYCHIGVEYRDRVTYLVLDRNRRIWAYINLKHDLLNINSTIQLPLKYFCKDNGMYFFSMAITLGEADRLDTLLKRGELKKEDVLSAFQNNSTQTNVLGCLEAACRESDLYQKRKHLIADGIKLHFEKRYSSAIAVLFPQLEGLMRDYGGIPSRGKLVPVIPERIWEENALYSVEDDARNYNAFTHRLFEGGKSETEFNRNPILHGFNISFESEEHSLLLMLTIIEIRYFIFWSGSLDFRENLKRYILRKTDGKPANHLGAHFDKLGAEIDVFQFPK